MYKRFENLSDRLEHSFMILKSEGKFFLTLLLVAFFAMSTQAQSEIYPQHFNLEEVTLLDGPFKTAMDINTEALLKYDADRLLTPFVREAGLANQSSSRYHNWLLEHPAFPNWDMPSWSLGGHIGAHYLTALSLSYASEHDVVRRAQLKKRLDEMLHVLDDCQRAYDKDTNGMKGFIGGQPLSRIWTELYAGRTAEFHKYGNWVPFYCEHKVLAGLRDAWLYTDSKLAKKLYRKLCDWSCEVVSHLDTKQMQGILKWEHGGMNEVLVDAYRLLGDRKYLEAAKRYCHQEMIDGMQSVNPTFLDNKHANTQVPKYIGFERIYQEEIRSGVAVHASYQQAAHHFWEDVAQNRTVCIGGNSVREHFLPNTKAEQYISNPDGPESCNSNNMLKLSEDLFDETHDAKYADFYEGTLWNHILSTQDPQSGGYVYFTSLRPQSYRIYSQANKVMWCCVGTGMENHAKYGHFIYTHSEDSKTLFVNLFTASKLASRNFALTQETAFPYAQTTKIIIDKAGSFVLAIRHPSWVGEAYAVKVNGTDLRVNVSVGKASYVKISRLWKVGDVVEVTLPMQLRYETCPHYEDYIAFKYGPILLAAKTTAASEDEAVRTGLKYEHLLNEYGGEGAKDQSPASMSKRLSLSSSPLLIGKREDIFKRITPTEKPCQFSIDVSDSQNEGRWPQLRLVPFYTIHHARYVCYWYQQTADNFENSDMYRNDVMEKNMLARTIDFVAPGEQQSEAGHDVAYGGLSNRGSYHDEFYREVKQGSYVEYALENKFGASDSISLMCRFNVADKGRIGTISIEGNQLQVVTIPASSEQVDANGFYQVEYIIPANMLLNADMTPKKKMLFRFSASGNTTSPRLYGLRLLHKVSSHK